MRRIKLLLAIATICFGLKSTSAQIKKDSLKPSIIHFVVGGGLGFTPQYEGSNDVLLLPAIILSANWSSGQYIRLAGLGINTNILSSKKWEFGPRLGFKVPRDESIVDNENIASIKELNFALSAGLFSRYKFGKGFDLEASYTQDISGVNDGGLVNLELGYTWRKKKFIHRIAINSSYATENYMDTYFGVNANNVRTSPLPFYNLEAGIKDIGTSISSIYLINRKWMLIGRLGYKTLLGDVADSPIVLEGNNNQLSGGIAFAYRF